MKNEYISRKDLISNIGIGFFKSPEKYDEFLKFVYSTKGIDVGNCPCSVGDLLYVFVGDTINEVEEFKVINLSINGRSGGMLCKDSSGQEMIIPFEAVGKCAFLSRDEVNRIQSLKYEKFLYELGILDEEQGGI